MIAVMQACAKFNVTVAPVAGSPDKHRVSVILSSSVSYSVRNAYTMTILAVVRVFSNCDIIKLTSSVRIRKMLMRGAGFASEASEKKFFPAPPGGPGKVIS